MFSVLGMTEVCLSLDLTTFEKAIDQLQQSVEVAFDDNYMHSQSETIRNIIMAGVIQHFEIVYELSWKFMQRWLKINFNPEQAEFPRTRKDLFRLAAKVGILENPLEWFAYAEARNMTSHTYDEEEAEKVFLLAPPLAIAAEKLLIRLKENG